MTVHRADAVVSKIVEDGCGARTLRLEFEGGNPFDFAPGQSVRLGLADDPPAAHPCAIGSSPLERSYLEVTLPSVTASTRPLFELKGGETLRVSGPEGDWVYRDDIKSAVFIAWGAGVAAFRCMIRYVLDKGLPNNLALIYVEKSPSCLLFRQELDEFAREGVQVLVSVMEPPIRDGEVWTGPIGPVTPELLRRAASRVKEPAYYVRGPEEFAARTRALLEKAGVPAGKIFVEVESLP